MKALKTEEGRKLREVYRKYWFHAGMWHKADCDFIRMDWGGCNCKAMDIFKELRAKGLPY